MATPLSPLPLLPLPHDRLYLEVHALKGGHKLLDRLWCGRRLLGVAVISIGSCRGKLGPFIHLLIPAASTDGLLHARLCGSTKSCLLRPRVRPGL